MSFIDGKWLRPEALLFGLVMLVGIPNLDDIVNELPVRLSLSFLDMPWFLCTCLQKISFVSYTCLSLSSEPWPLYSVLMVYRTKYATVLCF